MASETDEMAGALCVLLAIAILVVAIICDCVYPPRPGPNPQSGPMIGVRAGNASCGADNYPEQLYFQNWREGSDGKVIPWHSHRPWLGNEPNEPNEPGKELPDGK